MMKVISSTGRGGLQSLVVKGKDSEYASLWYG